MGRGITASAVGLIVFVCAAFAQTANAATCELQGSTLNATVVGLETATLTRSRAAISVRDATGQAVPCSGGSPTVFNVDKIKLVGYEGSDYETPHWTIDLAGGAFAPGATAEADTSEIEIEVAVRANTTVLGSSANDSFVVGAGAADTDVDDFSVNLNAAAELLTGGDVDLVVKTGGSTIDGAGGNDRITANGGSGTGAPNQSGFTYLRGGPGNDQVTAGYGAHYVSGDAGDDVLDANQFGSGKGLAYVDAEQPVRVSLGDHDPQDTGGAGVDTILNEFDALTGGKGDDVLIGGARNETINGGPGNDTLRGLVANDMLNGGEGDDVLDGGPGDDDMDGGHQGNDAVSYEGITGGVTMNLGVQTQGFYNKEEQRQNTTSAGNDFIYDIESLIGSPGGDQLTGNDLPNTIDGGGGNDNIDAKAGDDVLRLRDTAADTAACGLGNDSVFADESGVDQLAADCETIEFDDLTPPETTLTAGPSGDTSDDTPTFEFAASESGSVFECRVDTAEFATCASPLTLEKLAAGDHVFEVRARDARGIADPSPARRAFTVVSSDGAGPGPDPGPNGDTAAPTLAEMKASPRRFRARTKGGPVATKKGTLLTFRLSEAALLRFQVQRRAVGRRNAKGDCVNKTRRNRKRRECTRWTKLRPAFEAPRGAGVGSVRFSGRVGKRALRPGRYRLRIVAVDAAGNKSKPKFLRFRILRPNR